MGLVVYLFAYRILGDLNEKPAIFANGRKAGGNLSKIGVGGQGLGRCLVLVLITLPTFLDALNYSGGEWWFAQADA